MREHLGTVEGMRTVWRWAVFGMVFNLCLTGGKWAVYAFTLSAVILSDAIESLVNVLSSGFVLYAVWLSQRPRDVDHPYGHGKVEYFSAGFEGALVLGAACAIAGVSIWRLVEPVQPHLLGWGAAMELLIALVTLGVGQAMIRAGTKWESMSLKADGVHIRSDAITSGAAFVGILAVLFTGQMWLDATVALMVSVWLMINGVMVVREAVAGLMDEANPELLDEIAASLESVRQPGWLAPHHVKVHRLGPSVHIDMHMVFPAFWSIEEVHAHTQTIERALAVQFGTQTETMIHMESCTPRSCSYCVVEDCPIRQHPFKRKLAWDSAQIRATHRAKLPEAPPEA